MWAGIVVADAVDLCTGAVERRGRCVLQPVHWWVLLPGCRFVDAFACSRRVCGGVCVSGRVGQCHGGTVRAWVLLSDRHK